MQPGVEANCNYIGLMKLPEKPVCKKHTQINERKKTNNQMFHIPKAVLYTWKFQEIYTCAMHIFSFISGL